MLIDVLPWDTAFFGMSVGAVRAGTFDPKVFEADSRAFDLVYIYERPGNDRNAVIESYCGPPADTRVTYKKLLDTPSPLPSGIEPYAGVEPDDRLLALALQSGAYSRFHTDKRFPAEAYKRLYREWISRSVDKTRACDVLIARDPRGPIEGFITLEIKNEAIRIGLVAVDERSRGKGIGLRLVEAAAYYARQRNFLYLMVSTQAANREACRLYEKCGFDVYETVHIYHYWKT